MLSYGPRLRTSQGPLPPSWVGSSAPEPPSLARPCRGCPHTAHPFRVHGAHLINRRLVPVKLGNWHQMQFVLSVWGGLNSCLSFFFSLEAETLKIVIGTPRFIVLHFIALCQYCIFYKLKACDSPTSKSAGTIFPTALAHLVPLCHVVIILELVQTLPPKRL